MYHHVPHAPPAAAMYHTGTPVFPGKTQSRGTCGTCGTCQDPCTTVFFRVVRGGTCAQPFPLTGPPPLLPPLVRRASRVPARRCLGFAVGSQGTCGIPLPSVSSLFRVHIAGTRWKRSCWTIGETWSARRPSPPPESRLPWASRPQAASLPGCGAEFVRVPHLLIGPRADGRRRVFLHHAQQSARPEGLQPRCQGQEGLPKLIVPPAHRRADFAVAWAGPATSGRVPAPWRGDHRAAAASLPGRASIRRRGFSTPGAARNMVMPIAPACQGRGQSRDASHRLGAVHVETPPS